MRMILVVQYTLDLSVSFQSTFVVLAFLFDTLDLLAVLIFSIVNDDSFNYYWRKQKIIMCFC